jgi:hypothetical protein
MQSTKSAKKRWEVLPQKEVWWLNCHQIQQGLETKATKVAEARFLLAKLGEK